MLSDLEYYELYKSGRFELYQKASMRHLSDSSRQTRSFSPNRFAKDVSDWIARLNIRYPVKQEEEKLLKSNHRQKSHA